ncbi:hypothetical protein X943_002062 [Babesia divergens]|uniref:Uncharacterized protein n=1 Tax=Babesia divergens TaxID=32595 RepID=A0AAD9GFH4_BABDI|nr:hypothetical protein X943_002062 [Babesia divergens]
MAKQRIMPRTGEQQIKKNLLEIPGSVMCKALLNILGNILGSLIGETGLHTGKASGDKARHLAIMPIVSEPLVKNVFEASRTIFPITLIRAPLPSLECPKICIGTHKVKVIKRSVGLRQTLLKGLRNLFSAVRMATGKMGICIVGPRVLKDTSTDKIGFSEDSAKGGSEASGLPLL